MFGAFLTACNRILNSNQGKIPNGIIQYSPLTGTGTDFKADNDLVGTGSEWSQDNLKGSCLVQNQTTDYVDGISVVDIASTWSMSLWCKKENSNMVNQYVLSIGDNTTEYIMVSLGNTTSNRVVFEVKGNTTEFDNSYATDIVTNRWYNIILTANNGVITLYLDGVQRYQLTTTFTANTPNITIGNHVTNRTKGMVGRYSQFRIFNKVLSSDDINNLHKRDLYNHPLIVDHDVVGVYPFYKDAKDNWFTQHNLTITGSVPFTDRAANFNNVSGNYLKTLLTTPDIYAIYFEYIPNNDITNATAKQEIVSFGSNLGVYCGSSDANATNETLLIMNGSNSTYITDTLTAGECNKIFFRFLNANIYKVIVNGEEVTTTANTNGHAGLITGGDRIALSENNPIDGKIQNLRLWSALISDDEELKISSGLETFDIFGDGSCIAWYRFNGNVLDEGNNGHDGIATSVTYLVDGVLNSQCIHFDGVDSVVELDDFLHGQNSRTEFSVSMHIRPLDTTNNYAYSIQGRFANNGDNYSYISQAGQKFRYTEGTWGGTYKYIDSDNTYTINQWYHIVATRSSSGIMRLYVDKVLQSSTNTANNITYSQYHTTFGGTTNSNNSNTYANIKVDIDEVRYFDKELTQSEVERLYAL